jgi:hypothetical protein
MRRLALVPLLALSLLLPACNSDDTPTKAEFAKEAERICKQAQDDLQDIGQGAESPDELAGVVEDVVERLRQSVEELNDLQRPDGDAGETAGRFVDAIDSQISDEGIPLLEDFRDAVEKNDRQAAQQALAKLEQIDESQTDSLARQIGAQACVE